MPSQVEFEAKDVDLAVQKASKKLNIPAEKLKYSVISYGSTGIFGLVGAKKARIRVTVPESAPQKPKKKQPRTEAEQAQIPNATSALPATGAPTSSQPPSEEALSTIPDPDSTGKLPDETALQTGKEALQQMVDAITSGSSISMETEDHERVRFDISGGNTAVLIGKHGQTLDAMQYLVEKIVNRQNEDRVRVQVDIEGYLKNRKDHLRELAGRLAEKVKRTGKPASAGQINAHDRRIIHMALKDDADIRTQSVGEGLYRKLMIFPKKNPQKKKPN